ncbi:MAG: sugar transferase [Planctomycetota bacterium]
MPDSPAATLDPPALAVSPTAPAGVRPRGPAAPHARDQAQLEAAAPPPPSSWYPRRGKRWLDLVALALAAPLVAGPLVALAIAVLAVYRDPRRVLFAQRRAGWRGCEFVLYKFRTMREAPAGEMESWRQGADGERVTRLGRFLRRTHLDELPQLYNVLRGDMHLVGPRPEMIEVEEWAREHVPGFAARLAIRPGITGLAQVTQGYAACDVAAYRRKLLLDRRYLARVSIGLDLRIALATLFWMLRGRGARWIPRSAGAPRAATRRPRAA